MYFVYEMVITYKKQDKKVIIECIKKFILYWEFVTKVS